MKALILMPMADQRGGGELMLWQLLEHARVSDIEWVVVFFEDGPLVQEFEKLGIRTYVVDTGRLRQVHRYVVAVWKIYALIKQEAADIVFSWSGKPHLYGAPAALAARVPAAWYQLGCPRGRHLSWMDRVVTLLPATCVFVLSRFGEEGQADLRPRRQTRLVYPSANLQRFDPEKLPSPAEAREILGLPPDGPLIGIVGRLQRWKGIHVFVQAMVQVLETHPEAHAVIVGGAHDLEPDYPEVVDGLIHKHRVQDRILWVGFQKNIPLWMQAMDIVVHASDKEPFGIVIIEAMALGKPVIAGAEGGPAEIITNEMNGLLVPFGQPHLLAKAIRRYLDDTVFSEQIGHAAVQRAEDFSHEEFANSFVAQLREIVE
jgi:glycosyltransferase involved in cell wall biosynthesis